MLIFQFLETKDLKLVALVKNHPKIYDMRLLIHKNIEHKKRTFAKTAMEPTLNTTGKNTILNKIIIPIFQFLINF